MREDTDQLVLEKAEKSMKTWSHMEDGAHSGKVPYPGLVYVQQTCSSPGPNP